MLNNECSFVLPSAPICILPYFLSPDHLICLRNIGGILSHHLSSTSSIIGGTAYGQNITTATTGKYLPNMHISLYSITAFLLPSIPSSFSAKIGTRMEDSHHSTPTHLLPLRSPSRLALSSTSARRAHSSICPELLDGRSLELGSCECGEHWASNDGKHRRVWSGDYGARVLRCGVESREESTEIERGGVVR